MNWTVLVTWQYEQVTWQYEPVTWQYELVTWQYEQVTWQYDLDCASHLVVCARLHYSYLAV